MALKEEKMEKKKDSDRKGNREGQGRHNFRGKGTHHRNTKMGFAEGSSRFPEREMTRKASAAHGRVHDHTTNSQKVQMQNDAKKDPSVMSSIHGIVGRSITSRTSHRGYRQTESPK